MAPHFDKGGARFGTDLADGSCFLKRNRTRAAGGEFVPRQATTNDRDIAVCLIFLSYAF